MIATPDERNRLMQRLRAEAHGAHIAQFHSLERQHYSECDLARPKRMNPATSRIRGPAAVVQKVFAIRQLVLDGPSNRMFRP